MCRFKIVTLLKQVMRLWPVEKIERVFELKLVASCIRLSLLLLAGGSKKE